MCNYNTKTKKIFYSLFFSHIYCFISAGFNGGDKINYLSSFFWHFLAGGCTGNSILTISFILWKLIKQPKNDTYFSQVFSLIVVISNIITMTIYGIGLLIWLITITTTYYKITSQAIKLVPIPSHVIDSDHQLFKVIQWWLYSPIGHFIAPAYFIIWFFRFEKTELLRKKLKLTISLCLIQPTLYFFYSYLRSKFGDKEYFKKFKARGVMSFLNSKKMLKKLDINHNYRFIGKIILFTFGFSLFSLIVCLILRYKRKLRNFFLNIKRNQIRK